MLDIKPSKYDLLTGNKPIPDLLHQFIDKQNRLEFEWDSSGILQSSGDEKSIIALKCL